MVDPFSKTFKELSKKIDDLKLLLASPKNFFTVLEKEKLSDTIKRLVVYFFLITLIAFSLALPIGYETSIFNPFLILLIALGELFISLLQVPGYIIVASLSKKQIPIKTSVIYPIVAKSIILLPLYCASILYLISESAVLLFIKGFLLYFFIIIPPLLFPFVIKNTMRTRNKLIVSLLTLIFSIIFSNAFIFTVTNGFKQDISSKLKPYIFAYDPIGAELIKISEKFKIENDETEIYMEILNDYMNILKNSIEAQNVDFNKYEKDEQIALKISEDVIRQFEAKYKDKLEDKKNYIEEKQEIINSTLKECKFDTTKGILSILSEYYEVIEKINNDFMKLSSFSIEDIKTVMALFEEVKKPMILSIEFLTQFTSCINIRVVAQKLGIIIL